MKKRSFSIFLILLCLSLISVPISLSSTTFSQSGFPNEMMFVIVSGLLLSPIFLTTLIVYAITTNYDYIKEKCYTEPLEKLREKGIKREEKIASDAAGFIVMSMVICLSLFVILGFTSIMNMISQLPIVQMIPLPPEVEKFISDDSHNALILHTITISYISPLLMFSLRHLHHSSSTGTDRFPGSRIVMGILISAVGISLIYMLYLTGSNYFDIPKLETKMDGSLFTLMTFASLIFSSIVWACDRLVFQKNKV